MTWCSGLYLHYRLQRDACLPGWAGRERYDRLRTRRGLDTGDASAAMALVGEEDGQAVRWLMNRRRAGAYLQSLRAASPPLDDSTP